MYSTTHLTIINEDMPVFGLAEPSQQQPTRKALEDEAFDRVFDTLHVLYKDMYGV